MSEPEIFIIRRFNKALHQCYDAFEPGFYYIDPLNIEESKKSNFDSTCLTCNACRRFLKRHGIPFGENGVSIFSSLEQKSCKRKISPETRMVYVSKKLSLIPSTIRLDGVTAINVTHLSSAFSITFSSIRNIFFGGSTITVKKVRELMKECSVFFESSHLLEDYIEDLEPETCKSLARALQHSFKLRSLSLLEFLNELEKDPPKACTHRKLTRELPKKLASTKNIPKILDEMFNPALVGANMIERKIATTYTDGVITLSWTSLCDLDLHVEIRDIDTGNKVNHIYFSNKSADGIKLDQDNQKGGTNAKPAVEIITFDPSLFQGRYQIFVSVLMFQSKGYKEVPFILVINQYGERIIHRETWSSDSHLDDVSKFEDGCFTTEIELKEAPARVEEEHRPALPDGFRILDDADVKALSKPVTIKAGTGEKLFLLVKTPNRNFKNPITAVPISNTQIAKDIEVGAADSNGFFPVQKNLLSEVNPVIAFKKSDFKFGKNKESREYREKNYSPYSNEFHSIDNCLASVGLPVVISNVVLEYYKEPKMISLFGKLPTTTSSSGKKFWSKYL